MKLTNPKRTIVANKIINDIPHTDPDVIDPITLAIDTMFANVEINEEIKALYESDPTVFRNNSIPIVLTTSNCSSVEYLSIPSIFTVKDCVEVLKNDSRVSDALIKRKLYYANYTTLIRKIRSILQQYSTVERLLEDYPEFAKAAMWYGPVTSGREPNTIIRELLDLGWQPDRA